MAQKILSILLTDDDPDDQFLFQEALFEADQSVSFSAASDGIDVLQKLNALASYPDLIFLDVNMPRMNGIECLKELQKSETLKGIPVIMYSTSSYYKKECFEHGASDYIEKLDDFSKLTDALRHILNEGLPFPKKGIPS